MDKLYDETDFAGPAATRGGGDSDGSGTGVPTGVKIGVAVACIFAGGSLIALQFVGSGDAVDAAAFHLSVQPTGELIRLHGEYAASVDAAAERGDAARESMLREALERYAATLAERGVDPDDRSTWPEEVVLAFEAEAEAAGP